jgi:hypothetical protein
MSPKRENKSIRDRLEKRLMDASAGMGFESRQRLWQLLRSAEGLCEICSAPITHYSTMCDGCAEKRRAQTRLRLKYKPWKPGGKGRPPKVRSEPPVAKG